MKEKRTTPDHLTPNVRQTELFVPGKVAGLGKSIRKQAEEAEKLIFAKTRARFWYLRDYLRQRRSSGKIRRVRRWIGLSFVVPAIGLASFSAAGTITYQLVSSGSELREILGVLATDVFATDSTLLTSGSPEKPQSSWFLMGRILAFFSPVLLFLLALLARKPMESVAEYRHSSLDLQDLYHRLEENLKRPASPEKRAPHEWAAWTAKCIAYYLKRIVIRAYKIRFSFPIPILATLILLVGLSSYAAYVAIIGVWPDAGIGLSKTGFSLTIFLYAWAAAAAGLGWMTLKSVSLEAFSQATVAREPILTGVQATADLISDISRSLLKEISVNRFKTYHLYLLTIALTEKAEGSTGKRRLALQLGLLSHHLDIRPKEAEQSLPAVLEKYRRLFRAYDQAVFSHIKHIETQLGRVEHCKLEIARELGIDGRRVCDHIFRFSPATYRGRLTKLQANLNSIRIDLEHIQTTQNLSLIDERFLDRLAGLIRQSERIFRYVENISLHQDSLQNAPNALEFVIALSKENTPSGAVQTYARALEQLTKDARFDELRVLSDIQTVHPMIDAHAELTNLVAALAGKRSRDGESPDWENQILNHLVAIQEKRSRHRLFHEHEEGLTNLERNSFSGLLSSINGLIYQERSFLREGFRNLANHYQYLAKRSGRRLWLVPLQHSRAIKTSIQAFVESLSKENRENLGIVICTGGPVRQDSGRRSLRAELLYETPMRPSQIYSVQASEIETYSRSLSTSGLVIFVGSTHSINENCICFSNPEPDLIEKAINATVSHSWTRFIALSEGYKTSTRTAASEVPFGLTELRADGTVPRVRLKVLSSQNPLDR